MSGINNTNQDWRSAIKRIGKFFGCCLWGVNLIGGTITHIYTQNPQWAITNIIVSVMAFPVVKEWYKAL